MSAVRQSIIFVDHRKPIRHVPPGMVEAVLNMTYAQHFAVTDDVMFFRSEGKSDGEYDVYMFGYGDKETKVASVVNESDMIETIKEVKMLGNSMAVALSMECKMLGIVPGDKIRITIEKA